MNEKNIQKGLSTVSIVPDYRTEIIRILKSSLAPRVMRDRVLDYHENDIASVMEELTKDERKRLYSVLNTEILASILEYSENRADYINELNIKRRIAVLNSFEPSIVVEYLENLDKTQRQTLLELMDGERRAEIELLNSFDDDEIGSRMSTNYVSIPSDSTVKSAMHELISQAAENDNISTIYVVDEDFVYVGAIDLKDLIIARKEQKLDGITMTSYPYIYATEQIDDCIERIKGYSEDSIPVLDAENKLVGVLLSQDMTQLVEDELGDDYAKLAGLSAEEDLNEPLKTSIGKRLPWLMVLLVLGMCVSGVVGMFEHVVSHLTLIVCFQSLVLGMAGNAGTQSLAVTIRVLMDESLSGKQSALLIAREARVGLANGIVLGLLSFVFIGFYIVLFKGEPFVYSFSVSMCTGIAILASIVISSVMGAVIPIIFKKLKFDPAVASGPMITTVNDLVAVVSYYGLAWILLINVLGL